MRSFVPAFAISLASLLHLAFGPAVIAACSCGAAFSSKIVSSAVFLTSEFCFRQPANYCGLETKIFCY